jgi:hypothetical protein
LPNVATPFDDSAKSKNLSEEDFTQSFSCLSLSSVSKLMPKVKEEEEERN